MKRTKKNEDLNMNTLFVRNKKSETGIALHKPFVRIKNRETGIALIALVITIIVLLILAGVTIAMLTGENGIITKTNEAKTRTIEAIARYEAGKEGEKVVSKKGATVWNNIKWGNSMSDDKGGVVEKARGLYNQNGYKSVKSTLCYGVQWSAVMNFMDSNYIINEEKGKPNCNEKSYVRDSTGKGNYIETENINPWEGNVTEIGKAPEYAVKNIYDMAGNVREWTMESYNTGGYYNNSGTNIPASGRYNYHPTGSNSYIGFRPTLYL